jgi:hypothetical protein
MHLDLGQRKMRILQKARLTTPADFYSHRRNRYARHAERGIGKFAWPTKRKADTERRQDEDSYAAIDELRPERPAPR